jgi:hypothetical protein
MEINTVIKHLLSDDQSLKDYYNGRIVSFAEVKRRMLLLEHGQNCFVPDHYYRLSQEKSFVGLTSMSDTLCNGLWHIANEHLELRENRIHVKQEKQTDWQELITRIPPLVLEAVFLCKQKLLICTNVETIQHYFYEVILPSTRYTALPYPYIPQVEVFLAKRRGFHDLHLHLNGSTETDLTWQDFLQSPDKVYRDMMDKYEASTPDSLLFKEQLEQESLYRPDQIYDLLRIARRLRNYIFALLYPTNKEALIDNKEELIARLINVNSPFFDSLKNPFSDFFSDDIWENYPMAIEGLMYVIIFRYLSKHQEDIISWIFHFYLLILGLANRLLVQQTHQFGFEQFQKLTVNELRTESEKEYSKRFLQLCGNELRNIRFLEGRFAPKDSEYKNLQLLTEIHKGWENLIKKNYKKLYPTNDPPELKLIAHFIKIKESGKDDYIRHKKLRKSVWQKAEVLARMKKKNASCVRDFVGVDAAASEFDAPPEVFAPAFRMLRRQGFRHFTYHAGEDFFHILSGLRAIYEAIEFHEMGHGDRIGHAVASGVDVDIWIKNVGPNILIRQGEYMDNLIFSYFLINEHNIQQLKVLLPQLALKITGYAFEIYEEYYPVEMLKKHGNCENIVR